MGDNTLLIRRPQANEWQKRPSSSERYCMEAMLVTSAIMGAERYRGSIKERLQHIPDGQERYDEIHEQLEALIIDLINSGPATTRKHFQDILHHGEIEVKVHSAVQIPGKMLLPEDCVKELVRSSIRQECAMCMKSASEAEKCKIFKVAIEAIPPEDIKEEAYGCPYQDFRLAGEE